MLLQQIYDADLGEYDTFTGNEIDTKCDSIDHCVMKCVQRLCQENNIA